MAKFYIGFLDHGLNLDCIKMKNKLQYGKSE